MQEFSVQEKVEQFQTSSEWGTVSTLEYEGKILIFFICKKYIVRQLNQSLVSPVEKQVGDNKW